MESDESAGGAAHGLSRSAPAAALPAAERAYEAPHLTPSLAAGRRPFSNSPFSNSPFSNSRSSTARRDC